MVTLVATVITVSPTRTGEARRVDALVEQQRVAIPKLRLSVDANPKTSSDYKSESREQAIRLLKSTPATHFHVSSTWSTIERQPGVLDVGELTHAIDASAPLPLAFTLKIIDAGNRQVPDRLRGAAWDSPAMVQGVSQLIDQLAPVLDDRRPWSYAIGNEIDMYFATRPGEIAAYARLLEQLKPIVKSRHPRASFTTVWQFNSIDRLRSTYAAVVATLDHIALTYYPIAADFSVRPVDQLARDLPRALAVAAPLPIAFHELGYPTATLLGSSPEQQAEFMRISFDAIRAAGTPRVLGATYLFQSDLPQWLVSDLVRAYGLDSDRFRAFITTLGLRDENDRPKPGWQEYVRQSELLSSPR